MPAESEFTVIYDGDALRDGSIDVRDLAPALLGLGDLVAETNREVTGGQVAVVLRVRSQFERGSFQVNLEIGQLYERFVQIFSSPEATAWATFLGLLGISGVFGLFQLVKRAKGRKPTAVVEIEQTNKVRIQFEGDQPVDVDKRVWRLFENSRARRAIQAVVQPLFHSGIEIFKFRHSNRETLSVNRSEAEDFIAPGNRSNETVSQSEKMLRIVSPSFKEDNKWRVNDGTSTFYVSLRDPAFLARVQDGSEAFRKGDILHAVLETVQWEEGGELHAEHSIIQVIRHESRPQQQPLL
jgi:hypothetical protein